MTTKDDFTADDVAQAVLKVYNTLSLLDGLDGYKPDTPEYADAQPFKIPFPRNIAEAVEEFNQPGLREKLVELLYEGESK